jgi:hypothetical protein
MGRLYLLSVVTANFLLPLALMGCSWILGQPYTRRLELALGRSSHPVLNGLLWNAEYLGSYSGELAALVHPK